VSDGAAAAGAVAASIVLPVHNQADHIAGVVAGYVDVLDRLEWPYELVLVTNGCTDDSVPVCAELSERLDPVRTIDLAEGGWGKAVLAGIAASRGNHVCYTNTARTTPEMLALALSYARAYPTVVVKANRKIRDNWRRRLGSLIYNLECRALFDLPTWDINGTPKVFPRSFERLLQLQRDDDLIDAELLALCRIEGYPVVEVPLLATHRHGGKSTTNYGSALRMYTGALALRRRLAPPRA
jgi:glycosyltransferase involved in cell wall biosynthesis